MQEQNLLTMKTDFNGILSSSTKERISKEIGVLGIIINHLLDKGRWHKFELPSTCPHIKEWNVK